MTTMDWNRTKTIFIVTFLLLNVYLTWQLVETNNANQMSLIKEVTIQEMLIENNVTIDVELPEVEILSPLIVGKHVPFEEGELVTNGQLIEMEEDHAIQSILEEPFFLSEEQFFEDLIQFLSSYVYKGMDYRFGGYELETQSLYLYQAYEDYTAYTFDDEPLRLYLNDDREVVSYEQRYFEFEEQQDNEPEMLSSLKAIEKLWSDQLIGMNDTITDVQFGYYSFFSPAGDVQVFAPMWRVTVEEEIYLVHAINSSVQHLT
ncbi:two-component system regulatory protein YycI [Halalkalibacter sp. APA_J-10(15)]|uniref:two-component system regulatory protein YycI n=1 Tax=Halalkalibacter sp. APA_J-10(15) TaxID=2933805 RepID=UPI001FF3BB0C|nr:two-component system regulatory protein YycI [Halalkalibacter sp. APA_J-10(15)]MCK0469814.1 two-component system regulatory protein YycI [Halalkalibacter sp. APA_J-10(15)]